MAFRELELETERKTGFDCQLVETPPDHLLQTECPVCLQILREPHQVTCCGYSYCLSCIEHIRNKPCPTCNEENFAVYPNKGLKRSLYALKVHCSYQKDGCEWTGELGQLDKHLNSNPTPAKQLDGCQFVEIVCLDCDAIVKRCDFDHHISIDCSVTVLCDFHHIGCALKLPRKDMPEHLRENLLTHISLLATSHAKQQDEITRHKVQIAELTKLTADQQNQIVLLHAENKSLRSVDPEIEIAREITVPVETSEIVTLTNFQQQKDEDTVWFSPPLYTHSQGYKICFAVYPNGDGAGKNTHISVYSYLMPGEFDDTLTWPIRGEIRYQLLNQEDGENHREGVSTYHERRSDKSCARVLYAKRSQGLGMGRFLPQGLLPKYLQKDCLKFRIYGGNVRM